MEMMLLPKQLTKPTTDDPVSRSTWMIRTAQHIQATTLSKTTAIELRIRILWLGIACECDPISYDDFQFLIAELSVLNIKAVATLTYS